VTLLNRGRQESVHDAAPGALQAEAYSLV
jgi:hypothetical protein